MLTPLSALLIALAPLPALAQNTFWVFDSSEDQVKNGPEVDGSTNSPATGANRMTYDPVRHEVRFTFGWSGLQGRLTKLHVHGPADPSTSNPNHLYELWNSASEVDAAGVDPFSDSYSGVIEVNDTTTDCDSGGMIACFLEDRAYVNVHTEAFPMGEIRGNLVTVEMTPTVHPLGPIAALGLAGVLLLRRVRPVAA